MAITPAVADVEQSDLATSVEAYRHRLEHLTSEGRRLRGAIASASDSAPILAALGAWQRQCASTIHGLSGGSKAHWLSRAYSESLLVPSATAESASLTTIIDRVLDVLARAEMSLEHAGAPPAGVQPVRARFTFIADENLRASLERAYHDAQASFTAGSFAMALVTLSSILEAVLTEALERCGSDRLASCDAPPGPIARWSFANRITVAERARLISNGCARLPANAREYQRLLDAQGEIRPETSVSAGDAIRVRQVLHVILRDLAPGR